MKYYLLLLVAAACEAEIITTDMDHGHFQAIYHGHGATSYQNVQIDNHDSIPVSTNYIDQAEISRFEDFEHHADLDHQPDVIPIVETHDGVQQIDISDAAPYEEFVIDDVELKSDVLEHYLDHFEGHDYDFHLRK